MTSDTDRPADRPEAITAGDLERLLERAAETGARRALHEVGLDGTDAAEDIRDLRSLLAGFRLAKQTAVQTAVRIITTGILLALNPDVEISRDTTTLYASDRDVFLFLVDDRNPIEAGRLPDGSPDLYFRGFYCWNSEVGAKTLGMASFYLRAVCQNRNLWGVEDFQEIRIRHSKYAASRFAHEAAPALTRFANSSPQGFVNGIKAARQQIVARSDEDRADFLRKRGFSKAESGKIIEQVLLESNRPPETVFDFVQGITRLARDKTQQDARLDMEGRAKKLLDRVG